LLVRLLKHLHFLYLGYLIQQVALIDIMATLVNLRQLTFDERPHLEYTQHLLALILEGKEVREELDFEGVWEFVLHFEVVKVEELR
jgi:hypothetical protein